MQIIIQIMQTNVKQTKQNAKRNPKGQYWSISERSKHSQNRPTSQCQFGFVLLTSNGAIDQAILQNYAESAFLSSKRASTLFAAKCTCKLHTVRDGLPSDLIVTCHQIQIAHRSRCKWKNEVDCNLRTVLRAI